MKDNRIRLTPSIQARMGKLRAIYGADMPDQELLLISLVDAERYNQGGAPAQTQPSSITPSTPTAVPLAEPATGDLFY